MKRHVAWLVPLSLAFFVTAGLVVRHHRLRAHAQAAEGPAKQLHTSRADAAAPTDPATPPTEAATTPAAPSPPLNRARLVGTVRGQDGAPCAALVVALGDQEIRGAREETRSSAEGKYVLLIREGQWRVHAECAGQISDPSDVYFSGEDEKVQDLAMQGGATVWGTLTDPKGATVPGAVVSCANSYDVPTNGVTTQADGRYRVAVPTGLVILHVEVRGFAPAIASAVVSAGQEVRLDLRLLQSLHISGRVTDEHGKGFAGAKVTASSDECTERNPYTAGRSVTTGEDGRYDLSDLIDVKHTVEVWSKGYYEEYTQGVPPGATDVDFVLATPGRVEARSVARGSGQPVEAYEVVLIEVGGHLGHHPTQASGGAFSFDGVKPGKYVVCAEGPRCAQGRSDVFEVRSGETARGVEIRFSPGGSIRVVVLSARTGLPIRQARVGCGRSLGSMSTDTDDQGCCTFDNVEPGEWKLDIDFMEDGPCFAPTGGSVTVVEGETVEKRFLLQDEARIYGRAILADGWPLADSEVYVNEVPPGLSRMGKTAADGAFDIHGLRAGKYRVSYQDERTGRSCGPAQPVEVRDGEAILVNLAPEPGARLHGIVRQGGRDLADVLVTISGGDGGEYHVQTNSEGVYSVDDVPPGIWHFRVGTAATDITVPDGVTELRQDIDLPPPSGR